MDESVRSLLEQAARLQRAGSLAQAEAIYRQILSRDPNDAEALHLLGVIARDTGHIDAAVKLVSRAIALQPRVAVYHRTLGHALQSQRRFEEAVAQWKASIEIDPDDAEAHAQVGSVLALLKRHAEALVHLERAAQLDPDSPGVQSNLGIAYAFVGRLEESIKALRRAVMLKPDAAEAHHNLAITLRQANFLEESERHSREAIRLNPQYLTASSGLLLTLQYRNHDPAKTFADHRDWEKRLAGRVAPMTTYRNTREPDRRLKIGYVSGDFRLHSVGFFIEGLIAAHDPTNVEVFCYSNVSQPDEVTRRIQGRAQRWRDISTMSDEQLAGQVARDGIDILVDLAGHTGGARLLAFARKPAPIQMTYLGYPNTTGLRSIDYRLTDVYADPVAGRASQIVITEDPFYTERLIHLPRASWCYLPPEEVPAVSFGNNAESITFASFNTLPKFSPEILELWCRILKSLPSAKLLLKSKGLEDPFTQRRLIQSFAKQGIDSSRITARGQTESLAEHFSIYNHVDIALDTFPYHGTTTTCESLYMGVPVVTLAGNRHVSRVGVSLLSAVGLEDLIASDADRYVEIARELAGNRQRLVNLRKALRSRMKESALMDAKGLAAAIEEAYRAVWRIWCGREL